MNVMDGFSFNGKIASVACGADPGFGKGGHDYSSAKLRVFAECE